MAELIGYAEELEALDKVSVNVTSRWLTGAHGWDGTPDHEIPELVQSRFAREDLEDIKAADLVVCFTEHPGAGPSQGGRHVEMGYALALGKRIAVVGPVENIFYAIPIVARYDDWPSLLFDLPAIEAIVEIRKVLA